MRFQNNIKAALRKVLPSGLTVELQRYRSYSIVERPLYVRIRLLSCIGLPKPILSQSRRLRSVLFVCFGNIMRSPMCEALMLRECAARMDAPTINSAGLNAIPGKSAHPWAIEAAKELGISLESHRARLLTRTMVDEASLIFTMDYHNQVQILSRYPEAHQKTFLLSAYAENSRSEIADPYYSDQEGTRRCFQTLAICIQNLIRSMQLKPERIS